MPPQASRLGAGLLLVLCEFVFAYLLGSCEHIRGIYVPMVHGGAQSVKALARTTFRQLIFPWGTLAFGLGGAFASVTIVQSLTLHSSGTAQKRAAPQFER